MGGSVLEKKMALIMCQTPLQSLIAGKIIDLFPEQIFYPVYTSYQWNSKHEHYADRIITKCGQGLKQELATNGDIITLVNQLAELDSDVIYLASIDAPHNLALLSRKPNLALYTYDDGSANITPKSFYFRHYQPIAIEGLDILWNKEKVRENSLNHFTIFDSDFNIVPTEKLIKVDLFPTPSKDVAVSKKSREVSVLIGQKILPSVEENIKMMGQVMSEFAIDYYFPFPGEIGKITKSDLVIETDQIFEEYYVQLLKEYDVIHLYHFYSTVAFNLRNDPRIKEHIINESFYNSWYFSI